MPGLFVATEVDAELDLLVEEHQSDVGLIDALIEELSVDEVALSSLGRDLPKTMYMLNPPFEIKKFGECWQRGLRIYSLKPFDEQGHRINFRVFVAHDVLSDDWFVLSVQPRSTCYDTTTDAFRDLVARYQGLGIPAFSSH